jgi:hypothetical protein
MQADKGALLGDELALVPSSGRGDTLGVNFKLSNGLSLI